MFDQMSLRVVASMLLWSVASVLFGLWYYNLTFATVTGVPETIHVKQNLDCLIAGGFFGLFFGALIGWPKSPTGVHAIGAIGAIVGVLLGANIKVDNWPFGGEPHYNGLVVAGISITSIGLIGLLFQKQARSFFSISSFLDRVSPSEHSDRLNDPRP